MCSWCAEASIALQLRRVQWLSVCSSEVQAEEGQPKGYLFNSLASLSSLQSNWPHGQQHFLPSLCRMTLPLVSPAFAAASHQRWGIQPIPWTLPLHFHGVLNGEFSAFSGSVGKAAAVVRVEICRTVLFQSIGSWNSSARNAVLPHGLISFQIQKWFIFDPILSFLTFCCCGNTSFFISIFGLWIE